jgi:16S rRNA (adenine1518-N6/adenine1519-N6)-dimethyltransferase
MTKYVLQTIFVVDEQDNPVGEFPKSEVWSKGLLHRIVRIMIEDEEGRILLQKRSKDMETFPDCWDHSAAGHVDAGEDYDQAAKRELQEELGLSGVGLKKIVTYRTNDEFNGRKLNRFNALYKAIVPSNQRFIPQESEVSELRWFTLDEVKQLLATQPDKVTEGLKQVIEDYYS